jgi:hypothetical protein
MASAQDVLDGLESQLESSLYGTYITPRTLIEVAPILSTGQVATRQVVHSVSSIAGTVLEGDDPLPTGWILNTGEHRLYWTATAPLFLPPVSILLPAPSAVVHVRAIGSVPLIYQGGYGADPGLVLAIMKKASKIMINYHDDSIVMRGTDSSKPLPLAGEDWTDDELKPLGTYRNLAAFR